jgi:drug/metabolite transporter (DMT)-like permease
MTALLIFVSVATFVAGQLLLKRAVNQLEELPSGDPRRRRAVLIFAASIFSMAITFFVNIGLLQKLELSYLFPFQGLSIIVVAFGSALFLKEKLSVELVTGAILVTAGLILVSAS